MQRITELDVMETHEEFGISFYGKVIGKGNTAITVCDGVNKDCLSIQQDGDNEDPDLILVFGREAIERLRDVLTLHLERIDKGEENAKAN